MAAACASLSPQVRQNYDAASLPAQFEQQPARSKKVIVVDIDDTIMRCSTLDALRLVFRLRDTRIKEIAGASEAMREMRKRWHVVILTGRDDFLKKRTLQWLDANGFPGVPVIFSPRIRLTSRSEENFKKEEIRRLKARGFDPVVGIGDTASDAAAYLANGMRALIIIRDEKDSDLRHLLRRLATEPNMQRSKDLTLVFERNKPTPVWERILKELEKNAEARP
jgi:hypothetical protein